MFFDHVTMAFKRDFLMFLVLSRQGSSSYCRDLSTRDVMSSRPVLADPYEARYLTVSCDWSNV